MSDWLPLPLLASEHGSKIDEVIVLIHLVMAVAFVLWGAFFVIPLIRYRAGARPKADYHGLKSKLPYVGVGLMAVAEAILLLFWSLPFWEDEVYALPELGEGYTEVRVIGQQFQWMVHYPGPDGAFGRTSIELINDQSNPLGLDGEDQAGQDDVYSLGVLHLPVDRQVLIHLTSRDMIHSLFLPEFRVKQDAIPGMSIPVHFTPTLTTVDFRTETKEPERDFQIACAQLCGLSHFDMRGTVVVDSQEDFDEWMAEEVRLKLERKDEDEWF